MKPAKTFSLHSNLTPQPNVKETLLCEYETLLKNIILSESMEVLLVPNTIRHIDVLQQIVQKSQGKYLYGLLNKLQFFNPGVDARFNWDPRVTEHKKDLNTQTKNVRSTKRPTMVSFSWLPNKIISKRKNCMLTQRPEVRTNILSKNEENKSMNTVRAKLTQSQNNVDSVTTLATQLLRDDAERSRDHNEVVFDSKGWSTGGCSAQMQAKNLSQLLPNLHSLAVESGSQDLLNLVQQAQNAAGRILHSYDAFRDGTSCWTPLKTELRLTANASTQVKVEDTQDTGSWLKTADRITELPVSNNKVDSVVLVHPSTSECNKNIQVSTAKGNLSDFPNQPPGRGVDVIDCSEVKGSSVTCEAPTRPTSINVGVQCLRADRDIQGWASRSMSRSKKGILYVQKEPAVINKSISQIDRMNDLLVSEQNTVRNLSAQLYLTKRELEEARDKWAEKEADLKAKLHSQQARELELVRLNTNLQTEVRLTKCQLAQLQVRLSMSDRVRSEREPLRDTTISSAYKRNLNGNHQAESVDSGNTLCSTEPTEAKPFEFISELTALIPALSRMLAEAQENTVDKYDHTQICASPPRPKQPITNPIIHKSHLRTQENVSRWQNSQQCHGDMLTSSANLQSQEHSVNPKLGSTFRLQLSPAENRSGSVSPASRPDSVSSVRSIDVLEFQNGLALLDQRINSVREALDSKTGFERY
ncbi:hypothetical protein P879_09298 [Paragonimus westermani]|uniref:Uncharacterized protein n=1 Tax=Paragonimus westermani TaxID=34504 RepID=A0A8T0D9N6_9TREM|nr:hypothetical protein P879_09298 [Paragonimus westermani]